MERRGLLAQAALFATVRRPCGRGARGMAAASKRRSTTGHLCTRRLWSTKVALPRDFVDKILPASLTPTTYLHMASLPFRTAMLPTILRLVSNRTAPVVKPISEKSIAPRRSGLSELRRHLDGSVTLDGHVVLPSHAERKAQLR